MENKKIGNFIKELRIANCWSQEDLANKIFCSRQKINRIENNNQYPNLEDLMMLSDLFQISIEELIYGEIKSTKNQKEIQNNFLQFLLLNNSKFKKLKLFNIGCIAVIFLLCILMLTIYFVQNYNTIKVYKFYGISDIYQISDGLLILTKDKIYFDVGKITPTVEQIEIYSEIAKTKKLVYKGSPDNILKDIYGYNAFVSYKDFINGKQNFYIRVNDKDIKLDFMEEFTNNSFWYNPKKEIGSLEYHSPETMIPPTILEEFSCSQNFCVLSRNDEVLTFNDNIFIITRKNINIIYDISNEIFTYKNTVNLNDEINFTIQKNKILCEKGNCEEASKIFEDFKNNYINIYLK